MHGCGGLFKNTGPRKTDAAGCTVKEIRKALLHGHAVNYLCRVLGQVEVSLPKSDPANHFTLTPAVLHFTAHLTGSRTPGDILIEIEVAEFRRRYNFGYS
jgi:hypothetical protein